MASAADGRVRSVRQFCSRWGWLIWDNLNWFRIHILVFSVVPFLFSGFFMAANPSHSSGHFRTDYLDALFMCFSAMTSCGLSTISISEISTGQQILLFILMIIGDISVVNLVTVFCRQIWIKRNCPQIAKLDQVHAKPDNEKTNQPSGINPNGDALRGRDREEDVCIHQRKPEDHSKAGSAKSHPDYENRQGLRRRHKQKSQYQEQRPLDTKIPHASSGRSAHSGRGGFPSPQSLIFNLFGRLFPTAAQSVSAFVRRNDNADGLHSSHPIHDLKEAVENRYGEHVDHQEDRISKRVKWLPPTLRAIVVGRNSDFFENELDDEELDLLVCLEYRATRLLTILLVAHQIFWTMVPFAIIAIYFAKIRAWDSVFIANGGPQSGTVNRSWFSLFQSVSGYSSCGLSLVDTLMVPFANNYLLIYVLLFPILIGNHALPLLLRFEVWLATVVVRNGSPLEVDLHFILAHSRRFFLYLLPQYHSWWLFAVEFIIIFVGTAFFAIFSRDTYLYLTLGSSWQKFTDGFFEVITSRASGFDIVPISSLVPALPFFYLVSMFSANYTLAMALRSTNVYEERALGLNKDHNHKDGEKGEVFSKYLKHHLLPQIYFDLWPIMLGTLLICVIERPKLTDGNNVGWLGVFQILFETTSGYATVGLSYGNPFNTSSLSASFRKLSKLVMILLMLRGRHRGLPLAIDRAIMFPIEYLREPNVERAADINRRVDDAREEANAP